MSATLEPPPKERRSTSKKKVARRFGGGFLIISIGLHLLLGAGATYYVVQTIVAKRKLTFKGGPPSPNPQQRAVEHKVEMAKKQNAMSAPAPTKRIATTGMSKVTLPDMPVMSNFSGNSQSKMNGAGGTGIDAMSSIEMQKPLAGNGAGGSVIPFFGLKTQTNIGSLTGQFYDFKQTRARKPTNLNTGNVRKIIGDFVRKGWNEALLGNYYRAPNPLYAPQVFIPKMRAEEGPMAFGVEKEVEPKMWIVHYKGKVSPPESGTYHFAGCGDDALFVKFNGKTVLCGSLGMGADGLVVKPEGAYRYGTWSGATGKNDPFVKVGSAVRVEVGKTYPIEILVGEIPGGSVHFVVLIEKEGATYQKTSDGEPILPVFKLTDSKIAPGNFPPFQQDGPVWRAVKDEKKDVFSVFKKSGEGGQ